VISRFSRHIGVLTLSFVIAVLAIGSTVAQVGFQSTLKRPPRKVAPYREPIDRLSAAMYPLSTAYLSPRAKLVPEFQYANFENNTLTFNAFPRRDLPLVPMTVNAYEYMRYRILRDLQEERYSLVSSSLREARQGNRRAGLSFGVSLPKRFDRIFGEGGGNLRVSGYRRISFSGRSQWTDFAENDAVAVSKFPSLNMEQISRFEITGTIGSKITVRVSQDSQTDIPLANRISIRYKGDDDDILKTVEAGNTNLSLPNTRFVGYSSRIQGLFGLKAEAQLGNLRLTGIASQEKGSSERAVISAAGEENATYIRDYQYVEGRIFDLGHKDEFNPYDRVQKIYVYEEVIRADVELNTARLYYDPTVPGAAFVDSIPVQEVEQDQYEIREVPERNLHFIHFTSQQRRAIGVYMEIARINASGDTLGVDTIGNITAGAGASYDLKVIRPTTAKYSPSDPTWDLMWRNCYPIPRNTTPEQLNIKVYKALPGREGTSSALEYQVTPGVNRDFYYLEILGLDQFNSKNDTIPNNIVDDRALIFEDEWGLLIFPNRQPFNSDTSYVDQNRVRKPPLLEKVPNIYTYDSESEKTEKSEYYIQYTSAGGLTSSVIRLNRANVIEGSERVTVNGEVLRKDVDYTINYDFGQVTLLRDINDPNAEVNVEFEYAPFLAVQKKTLLGLRAEYEWSQDLQFGTTILYKSDKAQDRKPRVGQETARAMVLDFDANFRLYPSFFTTLVDALPLVTTDARSVINVSGEIAQSRPNPNVNGEAFVDDFESALEKLTLGTTRPGWTLSSLPATLDTANQEYKRTKMLWHNLPAISREQVYDAETRQGEGALRPLRLVFRPDNVKRELDSATGDIVEVGEVNSWAGIMRYLGNRVDAKRAQLFEIRTRATRGVLHFDFGLINEDVDGDGATDTEDDDRNNRVTADEDVGLDGIPDPEEVDEFGRPGSETGDPDPAGDDWWFPDIENRQPPVPPGRVTQAFLDSLQDDYGYLRYEWLNGTEDNRDDPLVLGLPDEENIGGSSLEKRDAYFSYKLDLSSDEFLVDSSEFNGWRTFRIPVRDSLVVDTAVSYENPDGSITQPSWSKINYVRVWFDSKDVGTDTLGIEIADWYFVQSNWQDSLITSKLNSTSVFYVASISDEENVAFNTPAEPYYDKQNNITEAQRALSLVYDSLMFQDTGLVTKDLITAENYSGYRRMEAYVHGPPGVDQDSIGFFFRMGRDPQNYYEFRTVLRSGWNEGNYVNVDFNEITARKDSLLRNLENKSDTIRDTGAGKYRIVGLPNVNEVKWMAAGVVNLDSTELADGEVWIDELRVTDVRSDPGTAARLSLTGNMADLVNYNFSYEYRDPYFRGLSSATRGGSSNNLGSGSTNKNLSFGATLQFHKLLPRSWNASIPIGVGYSEATSTPLLRTGTDIVLPENVRNLEKSVNQTRRFSISESFDKKGKNPLFTVLLNRQKVGFSYTRSERISPTTPLNFAENYSVRSDYDMSIRTKLGLKLFAWTKWIPIARKASQSKLYFFPESWRWSANFNRSMSITEDTEGNLRSSLRRDLDARMNMNYKMFDNLTTTFNYSTRRDLSDPDDVNLQLSKLRLGIETNYTQSFRANYDPKLLGWLSTAFTYSANYTDTWDRSSESRNSSMKRDWSVNGNFNHMNLLGAGRGGSGLGGRSGSRPGSAGGGKGGRPFYDPPLAVLRFLTGWINPFSYHYSQGYNNSVPGMLDRPSLKYRFGLLDQADVERSPNTRNPSSSEGINYDAGTGFTFMGALRTDVRFSRSISRDLVRVGADRTERVSTGWPDLGISINQFGTLPLIKKYVNEFIRIFSPRTAYGRQVREERNLDLGLVTSRVETISRNPVLSLNFKAFRALSLTGSYTVNKSITERYNKNDGTLESETQATRKTIAISSKYSFSAPGGFAIPLLGKLKFKSLMTINMNIQYSAEEAITEFPDGSQSTGTKKSNFQVSPVISYEFSRQIKGGLRGRWEDSNDQTNNRKSHTRELQIWAEIRF
jgi:hypothetical protein